MAFLLASDGPRPSDATVLQAVGLSKSFFGQTVLAGASIALRNGEIRALLGENGAGKSTLINLLSGVHRPDSGLIVLDGQAVTLARPIDAWRLGISTIRQEFSLFPDLSVAESLFAGNLPLGRYGTVDWSRMNDLAGAAIARLGYAIDPRRRLAELSVAEQQLVEIARALTHRSRLIIMDEPTASLSLSEVAHLKQVVRSLSTEGIAILFVSHRLEEVMDLCETYSVLRDGRLVAQGAIADTTIDDMVRSMVGRDIEAPDLSERKSPGEVVLSVRGLSSPDGRSPPVREVSFDLRRGEIVGLAGIVGAGRTEIARMIFGLDRIGAGSMEMRGRDFRPATPKAAIAAGLALVPEDRKRQGLFPELDVVENFAASRLGRLGASLFLNRRAERASLTTFIRQLDVRAPRLDASVSTLSGGNQQKVVLARWMALHPEILIVDEPTRGVDIAAKADVHRELRRLASQGVAILVISSDLPEVLAISDRILTMCAGRLTGEVPASEATEEDLMQLMTRDLGFPS